MTDHNPTHWEKFPTHDQPNPPPSRENLDALSLAFEEWLATDYLRVSYEPKDFFRRYDPDWKE